MSAGRSFVLFPLGARRFALPSDRVTELARPGRVHEFPHTTQGVAGVLVRRAQIVPVCDVAEVLIGPEAPARRFYLIANRRLGAAAEWTAIPVTGECELVNADVCPRTPKLPAYVTGLLTSPAGEVVEVVDLEMLIAHAGAGERRA